MEVKDYKKYSHPLKRYQDALRELGIKGREHPQTTCGIRGRAESLERHSRKHAAKNPHDIRCAKDAH